MPSGVRVQVSPLLPFRMFQQGKPGDKKFCELCGYKVECLGKPGCDYWSSYFEWKRFHEKRRAEDFLNFQIWCLAIVLILAFTWMFKLL